MNLIKIDFSKVNTEAAFNELLKEKLGWELEKEINLNNTPRTLEFSNLDFLQQTVPQLYNDFIKKLIEFQQTHGDRAIILKNAGLTEKQKMLSGLLYLADDEVLTAERDRAKKLFQQYNATTENQKDERPKILRNLIGHMGDSVQIEPFFYCDYGYNISLGDNVFLNYNCTFLDVMPITIGNNVLIAPNVQIYTATHPMVRESRSKLYEYAKPITIGNDVWIGGGAIINPGVTIGNNVVVGSGAVVTRDMGDNVFVAGNPARVIKAID